MSGWRGWTEVVSRVEYAARMGEYNLGRAAGLRWPTPTRLAREGKEVDRKEGGGRQPD